MGILANELNEFGHGQRIDMLRRHWGPGIMAVQTPGTACAFIQERPYANFGHYHGSRLPTVAYYYISDGSTLQHFACKRTLQQNTRMATRPWTTPSDRLRVRVQYSTRSLLCVIQLHAGIDWICDEWPGTHLYLR